MTATMPEIRERLETELACRTVDGPAGEQVTRSADVSDRAQAAQSARLEDSLAAATNRERMEIRHAIDRIDSGDYGRCLGCGGEINPGRLDAIPWAALCVDCQQEWEELQAS